MVGPVTIIFVIIAAIAFLGGGGVGFIKSAFATKDEENGEPLPGTQKTPQFGGFGSAAAQKSALEKAIAESRAKFPEAFAKAEAKPGTVESQTLAPLVVSKFQSGASGTIPLKPGSALAIERIETSQIARTDIRSKQKFNPELGKPSLKTSFDNPKSGGIGGQIGTTQFSTGESFKLSRGELQDIRQKELTSRERIDLLALQQRFARKTQEKQRIATAPRELIFQKREQEALAIKQIESKFGPGAFVQVGGATTRSGATLGITPQKKLFAKPGFEFGGVTREVFEQQQRDKEIQAVKVAATRQAAARQTAVGADIIRLAGLSEESQRIFLASKGINLQGGPLNQRALGRLREQGLI